MHLTTQLKGNLGEAGYIILLLHSNEALTRPYLTHTEHVPKPQYVQCTHLSSICSDVFEFLVQVWGRGAHPKSATTHPPTKVPSPSPTIDSTQRLFCGSLAVLRISLPAREESYLQRM